MNSKQEKELNINIDNIGICTIDPRWKVLQSNSKIVDLETEKDHIKYSIKMLENNIVMIQDEIDKIKRNDRN